MEKIGNVSAGVQESTQDILDIRAKSKTSAQADANGLITGYAFRNSDTISNDLEIPASENCVMAGPITVASGVTLTVNGTLVIV